MTRRNNDSAAAENKAALCALQSLLGRMERHFDRIATDMTDCVSNADEVMAREAHARMIALGRGIMAVYPARRADFEPGFILKTFLIDAIQIGPAAVHMGLGNLSCRKSAYEFTAGLLTEHPTIYAFWEREVECISAISDMDDDLKEMVYGSDIETYWPAIMRATGEIAEEMRLMLHASAPGQAFSAPARTPL